LRKSLAAPRLPVLAILSTAAMICLWANVPQIHALQGLLPPYCGEVRSARSTDCGSHGRGPRFDPLCVHHSRPREIGAFCIFTRRLGSCRQFSAAPSSNGRATRSLFNLLP
jgi:hypothetical protein